MSVPNDPRELLAQCIIRLRTVTESERPAVVAELVPLLGNPRIPVIVRLATAGRAIDALPDKSRAIRPVVRAITAGLSPARALHRLWHLQHLTEKATALDRIVARRERRVKMGCPRCGVRLPRAEMAKHLWHEHDLTLVRGKTRSRRLAVEAIRREYTALEDPAFFDQAAVLGGETAMRAWVAETATEEESLPLCTSASERGVGLCPVCFSDVRPRVVELPSPLAVAYGRLAGDGHVAIASRSLPPRLIATLTSVFVLFVCAAFGRVGLGVAFALVTYLATLVARDWLSPMRSRDDDAINAAWRKLASWLTDRGDAARFLTRLCLTSIDRGDPMERVNALNRVIARARDNPAERQLLAVALTLQMDDSGRLGRDRAAAIADLVAMAFREEQPADFAECVLAAYFSVPREESERERLRILLHAAAFAAEFTPTDVISLCNAAPHIASAMRLPPHHLAMLYGVWMHRSTRPWAKVGTAQTVFDLATTSRTTAGKVLDREPGLLLVCDSPPEVEAELGPVLIAVGGVSVGNATVLDPMADVLVDAEGQKLIFGKHTLRVSEPVPLEFADELKAWLRFRTDELGAYPTRYLREEERATARVLRPFVVRCSTCGKECTPVVGAIAQPLET